MDQRTTTIMKHSGCNDDKFLEKKTKREEFQKKKEKTSKFNRKWVPYKYLSFHEKQKLIDIAAFKDEQKQVNFANNKKNFIKGRHNKPQTPHNTSQYLTTNFTEEQPEKTIGFYGSTLNLPTINLEKDFEMDMYGGEENLNLENICITGGSMKGKLNYSNFLGTFEQAENKFLSPESNLNKANNKNSNENPLSSNLLTNKKCEKTEEKPEKLSARIELKSLDSIEFKDKVARIPLKSVINYQSKQSNDAYILEKESESAIKRRNLFLINCLTIEEDVNEILRQSMDFLYEKLNENDQLHTISYTGREYDYCKYNLITKGKKENSREEIKELSLSKKDYSENKENIESAGLIREKHIDSTINLLFQKILENKKPVKFEEVKDNTPEDFYSIIFLSNELQVSFHERVNTLLNNLSLKNQNFTINTLGFRTSLNKYSSLSKSDSDLSFSPSQSLSGIPNIYDDSVNVHVCNSPSHTSMPFHKVTLVNYQEMISLVLNKYLKYNKFSEDIGYLDAVIKIIRSRPGECEGFSPVDEEVIDVKIDVKDIPNTTESITSKNTFRVHDSNGMFKVKLLWFPLREIKRHFPLIFDIDLELANVESAEIINEFSIFYECELKQRKTPETATNVITDVICNSRTLTAMDYLHLKDITHVIERLENQENTDNYEKLESNTLEWFDEQILLKSPLHQVAKDNSYNIYNINNIKPRVTIGCFLTKSDTDLCQDPTNYYIVESANDKRNILNDLKEIQSKQVLNVHKTDII